MAADVHGKNHREATGHSAPTWWVGLLTTGPARSWSCGRPARPPDIFWATVGGMGLTGVIQSGGLRLRRAVLAVDAGGRAALAPDLSGCSTRTRAHREGHHAVAWLDGHRGGAGPGAGVVSTAGFADVDRPAVAVPPRSAALPAPPSATGDVAARAAAWCGRPPWRSPTAAHLSGGPASGGGARLEPLAAVLHPLDVLRGWPGLYGQCRTRAVPVRGADRSRADAGGRAGVDEGGRYSRVAGRPEAARRGRAPAALSFPQPGWTLALDFPASAAGSRRRARRP